MAHQDKGHYSAKHKNTTRDERIAAAIQSRAGAGQLPCRVAEKLAAGLGVLMAEIGRNADLLEIRIGGCQLGLFGHTRAEKRVKPAQEVSPELESVIRSRLTGSPEGPISCAAVWDIALLREMPRAEVSAACEKLGIKIKPCQLGAF